MSLNIIREQFDPKASHMTTLTEERVFKVCMLVIDAMRRGLPQEAHSMEVFDYILAESREALHSMRIELK